MNHQSVLITGGSQGIGLACAQKLYGQGYAVSLLSRSREKLDQAADCIAGGSRERLFTVSCDITRKESVQAAVREAATHWGRIDVLIHSAGCSMHAPCPLKDVSQEEYIRILRTNTDGLFWASQAVLPYMEEQGGGYILNILSTASHEAGAGNAPYSASKFAAKALTDTLIQEYRNTNIRISSISPGPVATTIWSHKTTPPGEEQMERMLKPQDIADIASFLISTPPNVHIRDLVVTPWMY